MSNIEDNNDHKLDCSGGVTSGKKECTSCEHNNVDNITEGIDNVDLLDDMSTCANCGKEGNSDDMNICNKCKMVKYCNAACKKKHRTKHKKACERRVAELHEEQLFKDHPPNEECPLCFIPRPHESSKSNFKTCCGKFICLGCIYAMKMSEGKDLCAFCRTPAPEGEEEIKRTKQLMKKGNAYAHNFLGYSYALGLRGLPQDHQKANELYLKAGELGCADGYYNVGISYDNGYGVEVDKKKAKYYYELAAMAGHVGARNNLGCEEALAGNIDRAMKHFVMAAMAGDERSLDNVKKGFTKGAVTKDEFANTLRAYHERQKEMKSDMRDKADAQSQGDLVVNIQT